MPCNWSTAASFLSRSSNPTRLTTSFRSQLTYRLLHQSSLFARAPQTPTYPQWTPPRGFFERLAISPNSFITRLARAFGGVALAVNTAPPPPPPPVNSSSSLSSQVASTTAQLSGPQVSRAVAQAVRLCIKEGGFGDALYLVNSACHSVLGGGTELRTNQDTRTPQLEPISFGRHVSPRLAAHTFLHGLIRGGYTRKAATYAKLMVEAGIPLRAQTLESVVTSVSKSRLPKFGPFARVIPRKSVDLSKSFTFLATGRISDKCTNAALELLQTARSFGQKRTERMYRVLVDTLLMQGEIIVASLLIALLIKDWELRKVLEGQAPDSAPQNWVSYDHLDITPPSYPSIITSPYPDLKAMGVIIETIDRSLELPHGFEEGSPLLPYLQSLAIFAMLLDTGQLHTNRVAVLIRALYRCPKSDASVWILQDGEVVKVAAYPYFHAVLTRFVNSLSIKDQSGNVPRYPMRVYNTLLHYALRHRLSSTMASQILQHMSVLRNPPIAPDLTTYNILLRSGSHLRKNGISEAALAALRASAAKAGPERTAANDAAPRPQLADCDSHNTVEEAVDTQAIECGTTLGFEDVLARLKSENLILPEEIANSTLGAKPNNYTITSVVCYLASTGRPNAVADMLFNLLPELHTVDHPATNGPMRSTPPRSEQARQRALKHAARRGPHVYAAIINALGKAGDVGLAERVFILAEQASRASYKYAQDGIKPWQVSVHAYTSLMQCYAAVVRRDLPSFKLSRFNPGGSLLGDNPSWRSRRRRSCLGFARLESMKHWIGRRKWYTKRQTSRRNGMLLYRAMLSGGQLLLRTAILNNSSPTGPVQRLVTRQDGIPVYKVKPDARFFSAALKLITGPVRVKRLRRVRGGKKSRRWVVMAKASGQWTPMLHRIAKAMVAHGFDVPKEYRHLLAEKWTTSMRAKRRRVVVPRVPYAYPKLEQRDRSVLPIVKTKGLPVQKRRFRGRRTNARAVP